MNFSSFKYLVKQGWHNMGANKLMSLASVGVLTACLIITGIAGLLSANVNSYVDYLGDQNEMILYLYDDITEENRAAIEATFTVENNIEDVYYISKEEALQSEIERFGEFGQLIESYQGDKNPFPASFHIKLEALTLEALENAEKMYQTMPGVEGVGSAAELVRILLGLKKVVTIAGWGLVAALGLVSLVVIANTIRLTVFARRKEINIMKFVGATNAFIRLPFLVEGITVGISAAVLAFAVVSGAYIGIFELIKNDVSWLGTLTANMLPYAKVWYWLLGAFVGSGIVVGGIGSTSSMRKYLKV